MSDGLDVLGADEIGLLDADEIGALFGDPSFQVATQGTETREGYEERVRGYFLGRGATAGDIRNYMNSFGDSYWRKPGGGYSAPRASAPLYAASGYTAARGCHANGMTIWHFLFFAVLLMAIFFAPRVFVFVKKHAAPLLRDGLRAVSAFGRRLRRSTT